MIATLSTCEPAHAAELVPQAIPSHDLPEFYRLTERNQQRVRKMLAAFALIASAAKIKHGIQLAVGSYGGERGFSSSRLTSYYYEWRQSGDWRVCVDGALENSPKWANDWPEEFLLFLQKRVDANGRSIETELKKIRLEWFDGRLIPGYGTWRDWWHKTHPGEPDPVTCPGCPQGWSARNLRRKLDSSKFRRTAQTHSRFAAKKYRPQVYTTRAGLWTGSHYMFDDLEHDFFINTFAEMQAGRPLELFSHDLYSARKVRYGIRVKTQRDDGSLKKLTGQMSRMIVAATLYLDGYSPRGTTLVAEHGTAAVSEEVERVLAEYSPLITVERSGFTGAAAHAGLYPELRRGNPNFKASLESSNRTKHALTADLPGQAGTTIAQRPEQLAALLEYNKMRLAAYQQLPPELARRFEWDLLELNQFMPLLANYYSFWERMTEHHLEGWEACGHTIQELHLAGRWITQEQLLMLPAPQQEMVRALLHAGQLEARPRRMSRLEAWQTGAPELLKIPGYVVCAILGDDFAAERKVRNHMFVFEDKEVGPGEHRFHSRITTPEGYTLELKEGEIYQVFINPFAPDVLHVRDVKGRCLGDAERVLTPCRGDYDGVARAVRVAVKRETELLAPLRDRHVEEARERARIAKHNADLVTGTLPEDKKRQRALKDFSGDSSELLDSQENTAATKAAAVPEDQSTEQEFNPNDLL